MSTGISFKTAIGIFILLAVVLFLIGGVLIYANLRGIGIESGYPIDSPLDELQLWEDHPPQWFSDGRRIAFSHEGTVYVVDPAGSHLQLVDGGDGELDLAHGPSVSPDGSQIAYVAYEESGWLSWYTPESWEIVTARPDGSDRLRLTKNDRMDLNPVWSRDGTRIFFHKTGALYAVAADGSDESVKVVDLEVPIARVFSLSPDGSHIAFVAGGQGRTGVYVVTTDGSNVRRLVDNADRPVSLVLAWSPDSRRIAYVKGKVVGGELVADGIYTVGIDDSDVRKIISFPGLQVGWSWVENISWSPDGSEILYGTTVIAADGSAVWELAIGGHASWSPDSSRIAVYNEAWLFGAVLYTVARDGTDARFLVEQNEDGSLFAAEGRPLG